MKAILLSTAIFSLFLTSCASSMITANNNSSATEFNTEVPAKATIEKKQIAITQVPTMVLAAVKKAYPTEMIKQMTRVSSSEGVYYEFQLQNKRKKPITVVFNDNAKEELAKK
jgi:ribosomal protein L14